MPTVKDREEFARYLAVVYLTQGAKRPQLHQQLLDRDYAVPFTTDGMISAR